MCRRPPIPAAETSVGLDSAAAQRERLLDSFDLPPVPRPGDANTVNAAGGGGNYGAAYGASYREIIDVNDWDRSVMTNVPGESGVPGNKHYDDLLGPWARGEYHPMPFSRKAVEAAAGRANLAGSREITRSLRLRRPLFQQPHRRHLCVIRFLLQYCRAHPGLNILRPRGQRKDILKRNAQYRFQQS